MKSRLKYGVSLDYQAHRKLMIDLHGRNSEKSSEKLYDSLYLGNPYGEPLLGLCFDGENLIGQENYIRQDVAFNGNIYKSALGVNTIVDSKYRITYGVFKELIRLTMDKLKENTDVICSNAIEESEKYYLKYFNWEVSSKVQVYKKGIGYRGLSAETVLAFLRPGRISKHLTLKEVKEFDPKVLTAIIDEHMNNSKYTYFYKTAEFLNWKYLKNSHYKLIGYEIESKGTICGYVVTYENGIELKVVDFLLKNDDADMFRDLTSTLSYIGSRKGKKRLVIYATPSCWYLKSLKKQFFIYRWDFDFITANLNKTPIGNQWVIQIGDFDIF